MDRKRGFFFETQRKKESVPFARVNFVKLWRSVRAKDIDSNRGRRREKQDGFEAANLCENNN